ncbi:hypothetical protein BG015_010789 [Linnemannia schmuckeri]|uniref:Uncharacterized protein n=1 Tax=Linnemannia schmuckeri TaxID=64567 RepID=A0A9P5RW99_9FUNG|nr:hypothetical protein BG015_010789 [Linnemannia schmuckeri]
MTVSPRKQMGAHIQNLLNKSSNVETVGQIYIIYERLDPFKWLPGKDHSKTHPTFKHWMLVIHLGDEKIKLHFGEYGKEVGVGMVMVSPYDPNVDPTKRYFLANISISTETLYSHIQDMFNECTKYSLTHNNCQHFVQKVVAHFERFLFNQDPHIHKREDMARSRAF